MSVIDDVPPGRLPPPTYDPARDERRAVVPPTTWLDHAPVTRALLALNIGVFILEVVLSWNLTHTWSLKPVSSVEMQLGASYPLATLGEGRWETLVTACFIHGGLTHIAFNMIALWQAGPLVERAVGSVRMAPMYLLAGALGNVASIAASFLLRNQNFGDYSVGASGAISGVIAAALVLGWRLQGWRGPLTQAMARWLGFVVIFGLLSNLSGGNIDNGAHIGGALAGGVIAATWKRGRYYPPATTRAVLLACVGVIAACIAVLSVREASSPFASMLVGERWDYTMRAVGDGRCRDAHDGLMAVERLRGPMDSLRKPVETTCGHVGDR